MARYIASLLSPTQGPLGIVLAALFVLPLYLFASGEITGTEIAALYWTAIQGLGLWFGIELAVALLFVGLLLLSQKSVAGR